MSSTAPLLGSTVITAGFIVVTVLLLGLALLLVRGRQQDRQAQEPGGWDWQETGPIRHLYGPQARNLLQETQPFQAVRDAPYATDASRL